MSLYTANAFPFVSSVFDSNTFSKLSWMLVGVIIVPFAFRFPASVSFIAQSKPAYSLLRMTGERFFAGVAVSVVVPVVVFDIVQDPVPSVISFVVSVTFVSSFRFVAVAVIDSIASLSVSLDETLVRVIGFVPILHICQESDDGAITDPSAFS